MTREPGFARSLKRSRRPVKSPQAERVRRLRDLEAVRRQAILDLPKVGSLDGVAEIARRVAGCRCAVIAVADCEGLFALSESGQASGAAAGRFEALAGRAGEPGIDTDAVCRAAVDPLAMAELGFRFYAGLPLRTADGHALGTLALVDPEARQLDDEVLATLRLLAQVIVDLLELRLAARAELAELRLDPE